ncbi:NADP-dependent oxidoreductase [Dactylosporangium matsuzakiense]|uniref:Oxidoreductase n=1 Tax=Dactylosporangium matsuzakiense TaxID=53360 RepID=A0A9W6KFV3_9ACTN|nr:NADP-dependent oxidoreductase [Dactylosporangium matsuzakiense]UWZ44050.1 NADP-dependent oxidoreductase [Dactylosporangium matsuzakiense]GLL00743.1 oxidoreductase [Dactylosporangium matsuzakiense]
MKAITLSADHHLALQDLPDPRPAPDQLLLAIRAAGVDRADLEHAEGVPGREVAGVVLARGPEVTGFVVGDEVYAWTDGAYAERAAVSEGTAAHKPAGFSFVEAAAVPRAAVAALQALRAAGTGEGDVVLVADAASGPGHFAVQIARALGAERVLGTASPEDDDFLRELGAEPAGVLPQADVVVEFTGGETTAAALRAVSDPARAVSTVNPAITAAGGRYASPTPSAADLRWLADLADRGLLRVALHRQLPLALAADAHRLLDSGEVRGKLVLTP